MRSIEVVVELEWYKAELSILQAQALQKETKMKECDAKVALSKLKSKSKLLQVAKDYGDLLKFNIKLEKEKVAQMKADHPVLDF